MKDQKVVAVRLEPKPFDLEIIRIEASIDINLNYAAIVQNSFVSDNCFLIKLDDLKL